MIDFIVCCVLGAPQFYILL